MPLLRVLTTCVCGVAPRRMSRAEQGGAQLDGRLGVEGAAALTEQLGLLVECRVGVQLEQLRSIAATSSARRGCDSCSRTTSSWA